MTEPTAIRAHQHCADCPSNATCVTKNKCTRTGAVLFVYPEGITHDSDAGFEARVRLSMAERAAEEGERAVEGDPTEIEDYMEGTIEEAGDGYGAEILADGTFMVTGPCGTVTVSPDKEPDEPHPFAGVRLHKGNVPLVEPTACTFCGKTRREVKRLVAAEVRVPDDVHSAMVAVAEATIPAICNECVAVANGLLLEKDGSVQVQVMPSMGAPQFPEHIKLKAAKVQFGTEYINRFLEWAEAEGIILCRWEENAEEKRREAQYEPLAHKEGRQATLARYAGIDVSKLSDEKDAMVAAQREVRQGQAEDLIAAARIGGGDGGATEERGRRAEVFDVLSQERAETILRLAGWVMDPAGRWNPGDTCKTPEVPQDEPEVIALVRQFMGRHAGAWGLAIAPEGHTTRHTLPLVTVGKVDAQGDVLDRAEAEAMIARGVLTPAQKSIPVKAGFERDAPRVGTLAALRLEGDQVIAEVDLLAQGEMLLAEGRKLALGGHVSRKRRGPGSYSMSGVMVTETALVDDKVE